MHQLIYLQWPSKTSCPNGRERGEENHHLMLGVRTSLFPVHPSLHLTVYICFIVHRFVNIISLPKIFVHNLGFVALFIQNLYGMFK